LLLLERPPEELWETGWNVRLADDEANRSLLKLYLRDYARESDLDISELLSSSSVVAIPNPLDECVALLCAHRDTQEAIARLIAHRLRHLVGDYADQNCLASAHSSSVVGATDVEAIVEAVLKLAGSDGLFPAVAAGLCEQVTFAPVDTPFFYKGIDVAPGHIASGLVLDRPDFIVEIASGLQRQRRTLIAGPSGSGKSAAAWLFAYQNRHTIRWYRLRRTPADDAHRLIQLARSLEASPRRPVGLVLDDVGRDLSGIWDTLSRELVYEPGRRFVAN
jgi:hypothetical protein